MACAGLLSSQAGGGNLSKVGGDEKPVVRGFVSLNLPGSVHRADMKSFFLSTLK